MSTLPIPQRIHRGDTEIVITWDAEHEGRYPARELRLQCQCAGCRDELSGIPLLDPRSVPPDVRPLAISLIGSYAVKIDWSDGHDTGIYSYEYLLATCPCARCRPADS